MHDKIKELLFRSKSAQDKRILSYLLKHYDQLPNFSTAKVADECYCSKTSVTRVIKQLNLNGYREFQSFVKYEHQSQDQLQSSGIDRMDLSDLKKIK